MARKQDTHAVPDPPELGNWDFARADTQELTHGMQYYPARMVPQIAERLLDMLWDQQTVILDPFAGSGTTILEALRKRHRGIGIDVNPVAIYLARAKCVVPKKPIDIIGLLSQITSTLHLLNLECNPIYLRTKKNIDYWYDRPVAEQLLGIREGICQYLNLINDNSQQWVLWATLMATVYACSRGTQDGSSFHMRKSPNYVKAPIPFFEKKLGENVARLERLAATFSPFEVQPAEGTLQDIISGKEGMTFNFTLGNALSTLCELPAEVIGGIITSPPYGDEHSTVNYTRYTKHAAVWLGITPQEVKQGSQETLSKQNLTELPPDVPETEQVLRALESVNLADYDKVVHFLSEFYASLVLFDKVLMPGAPCAIVIANRRVRGVDLPMDRVTAELATSAGFIVENTFYRTFPKKVVAWTTISGSSMDQENIVILRK